MSNAWCFICAKPQPCAHTKTPPKPPARESTLRHDGPPIWNIEGTHLGERFKEHVQIIVRAREIHLRDLAQQREETLRRAARAKGGHDGSLD